MGYSINALWFRNVKQGDAEAKQRRAELVLGSAAIFNELEAIVATEIEALEKTSSRDYDNPNWALKEADRKGQVAFARKMLELTKRTPV